jgi:hypothetical protein
MEFEPTWGLLAVPKNEGLLALDYEDIIIPKSKGDPEIFDCLHELTSGCCFQMESLLYCILNKDF